MLVRSVSESSPEEPGAFHAHTRDAAAMQPSSLLSLMPAIARCDRLAYSGSPQVRLLALRREGVLNKPCFTWASI